MLVSYACSAIARALLCSGGLIDFRSYKGGLLETEGLFQIDLR